MSPLKNALICTLRLHRRKKLPRSIWKTSSCSLCQQDPVRSVSRKLSRVDRASGLLIGWLAGKPCLRNLRSTGAQAGNGPHPASCPQEAYGLQLFTPLCVPLVEFRVKQTWWLGYMGLAPTFPLSSASIIQNFKICLQCGRPGFNLWVGKIP